MEIIKNIAIEFFKNPIIMKAIIFLLLLALSIGLFKYKIKKSSK